MELFKGLSEISKIPIEYLLEWQEDYGIWKKDGTLDIFRIEELKKDYYIDSNSVFKKYN